MKKTENDIFRSAVKRMKKEVLKATFKEADKMNALKESMTYHRDDDGRAKGEWHQGDKPEDAEETEAPEISPYEHGAPADDEKVGGKKLFEEDEDEREEHDHDRDAAKDDWDHIVKLARDAHEDHMRRDDGEEGEEDRDRHRDAAEDDWAHIHALAKDAGMDKEDEDHLEESFDETLHEMIKRQILATLKKGGE